MFFAVFPLQNLKFLLNQQLKEKETDMETWERSRLPMTEDFLEFRHFSVLHQCKLKVSQKVLQKKMSERGPFRSNREPEGKASCFGRCRISNSVLPYFWQAAQEVGNSLLCSESLLAFAEKYWPGAQKPFLMKVSSVSMCSHKVFWWADILQCRCFTSRVTDSSKYNTLRGLAVV